MSDNQSKFAIFQNADGEPTVAARFEDDDVWLTQDHLALLYHTSKPNVVMHIKSIIESGELEESAVVKKFLIPGKRFGKAADLRILHYSLDMIIALGYRIDSPTAIKFRQWATTRLHEYIQKGFALDDERLKQGGNRYFKELLQRIRDIRASERNFYQQVTDIYATAVDYDPRAELTRDFFATVQNKLHYAVHEHTAAEVIYERVDNEKPNVGMTSFKGDYVNDDSVDFILTDPPYGGLVQYMDLSMVWLVWLQRFDMRFRPDATGEITYKRGIVDRMTYKKRLTNAFKNAYRVLKPEHYLVVTFHNQHIREWNDFVCAIRDAGFVFEKMTHQYNRRSGESNVANPYGTTSSDYYIRCKKTTDSLIASDKDELSLYVVNRTRSILTERGEPTPFEFLLNGLLPDMLQAGYLQPNEPAVELRNILSREIGEDKMFSVSPNPKNQGGDIFWFNHPERYINHANMSLTDRVDSTIRGLLRRKVSVKYDDVVAEIFKEFPNGQTPDPRGLTKVVSRYANKSRGKWKLKADVERDCTEHTHIIASLCKLVKRSGALSHVGNREKREIVRDGVLLSDLSALKNLECLTEYDHAQLARVEMIDLVWVAGNPKKIAGVFEVENSTDFIGAIGRASNIPKSVPKFMILPKRREAEFLRYRDPYFVNGFRAQTWKYLLYDDIELLSTAKDISMSDIGRMAKEIVA